MRHRHVVVAVLTAVLAAGCGRAVLDEDRWTGAFRDDPEAPVGEVPGPGPAPLPEPPPPATAPPPTPVPEAETATVSTRTPATTGPGDGDGRCGVVHLTEFQLSAGTPGGVAADDDGSVWFTDPAAPAIGHLSAAGAVRRYRLPPGSTPSAITRGPDGNYWFLDPKLPSLEEMGTGTTATSAPLIGRITPDGVLAQFPLPTSEQNPMGGPGVGSLPWAIISGPDDALWFTEAGADQLGRITVDGRIGEFPVPSRPVMHAHLGGITVGSDGALWFQQSLRNSLGRFDPDTRTFQEFTKRDETNGGLIGGSDVVTGADRGLWFEGGTDTGPGLNRMAADGRVVHFPLPEDRTYRPEAVTADPGGGVWFLDTAGGGPMHMTFDGHFTSFGMDDPYGWRPSTVRPHMTTASDGTIWYAQPEGHRLGRIACG